MYAGDEDGSGPAMLDLQGYLYLDPWWATLLAHAALGLVGRAADRALSASPPRSSARAVYPATSSSRRVANPGSQLEIAIVTTRQAVTWPLSARRRSSRAGSIGSAYRPGVK